MTNHFNTLLTGIVLVAFSITDAFSQTTITLTSSNHNGYNISSFGGRDGAIDIAISNGNGTYSFIWTTGDTTQNVSGLAAGYYGVDIWEYTGTDTNYYRGEITLTQPGQITFVPDSADVVIKVNSEEK